MLYFSFVHCSDIQHSEEQEQVERACSLGASSLLPMQA